LMHIWPSPELTLRVNVLRCLWKPNIRQELMWVDRVWVGKTRRPYSERSTRAARCDYEHVLHGPQRRGRGQRFLDHDVERDAPLSDAARARRRALARRPRARAPR
jgi:hypothetical protein